MHVLDTSLSKSHESSLILLLWCHLVCLCHHLLLWDSCRVGLSQHLLLLWYLVESLLRHLPQLVLSCLLLLLLRLVLSHCLVLGKLHWLLGDLVLLFLLRKILDLRSCLSIGLRLHGSGLTSLELREPTFHSIND